VKRCGTGIGANVLARCAQWRKTLLNCGEFSPVSAKIPNGDEASLRRGIQ
jgi:hypothetical protein